MTKFAVNFESDGLDLLGLDPSFLMLKKLSSGDNISPLPIFSEVGYGFYSYEFGASDGATYIGKIDGGNSITTKSNRYKWIKESLEKDQEQEEVFAMPVYDSDSDILTFFVYLHRRGKVVTDVTSCAVTVRDSSHVAKWTINASSASNGVFILSKSGPSIVSGSAYYAELSIVVGPETVSSIECFKVIE